MFLPDATEEVSCVSGVEIDDDMRSRQLLPTSLPFVDRGEQLLEL